MRFISTRLHAMMDYFVAIFLIVCPWIFNFYEGNIDSWFLVGAGIVLFGYSLFTDFELGITRTISMTAHLWLDVLLGLFLCACPWLFRFTDHVFAPHLIVGLMEISVALFTKTVPSYVAKKRSAA